jgi:hypothetical protein
MSLVTALSSGLAGYRSAIERLAGASARPSRGPVETDLPADVVEMRVSQVAAAASIKALRTADEFLGSLLDVVR